MPFRIVTLVVLGFLATSVGCSQNSGPRFYPLTGKVTFNGEPVSTATLVLRDPAGQEKTCLAKVINGEISGESSPGEKIIEVTATRIAEGKTVPSADGIGKEQAIEQYIPEKYNVKSELKATISDKQPNQLMLDLTGP